MPTHANKPARSRRFLNTARLGVAAVLPIVAAGAVAGPAMATPHTAMSNYRFTDDEVDWSRPQRELADQALRDRVPLLDLLPQLQALPDRKELFLPIDTHFTAYGHAITAQIIAQYVESGGYVK